MARIHLATAGAPAMAHLPWIYLTLARASNNDRGTNSCAEMPLVGGKRKKILQRKFVAF